jgi:phospholipid/cholesterol/gamma-HCH transport system substrate-binding protein
MGSTRKTEILVGALMLIALLAFLALAFKISNLASFTSHQGYSIFAGFDNIGGLRKRAKVTVSGVRIGRVTDIQYDKKTLRAIVTMQLDAGVDYLSTDTQASIYTAGLLGEQYISLEPGAEDEVLKNGDFINITQSAVVLEEIIGKIMVNLSTK